MKKMKIVIRADKDPLCEKIPVCSVWILKDESKTSSSGCLVFFSSVALVFPSVKRLFRREKAAVSRAEFTSCVFPLSSLCVSVSMKHASARFCCSNSEQLLSAVPRAARRRAAVSFSSW